jgi:hypothetical protein
MKGTFLFTMAIVVVLTWGTANSQSDPAQSLIGKWEGEVSESGTGRTASNKGRTLIVKSAAKNDGKWTIDAVYGITGKGMAPVAVAVNEDGARLTLLFVTSFGTRISLHLFDAKSLVGTFRTPRAERENKMTLEKVDAH